MLSTKKIVGLFTLFIGLTFAMFSISTGQQLADKSPKSVKATLSGVAIDAANQQPVSGATVSVSMVNKETQTGKQGEFSFEALDSGSYELKVEHSDYETYTKSIEIKDQNKQLTIELERKSQ